jgi:hypothetical protein
MRAGPMGRIAHYKIVMRAHGTVSFSRATIRTELGTHDSLKKGVSDEYEALVSTAQYGVGGIPPDRAMHVE